MTWFDQIVPFADAALLLNLDGQVVGTYLAYPDSHETLSLMGNVKIIVNNLLNHLNTLSLHSMRLVAHTQPILIRTICTHYLVVLARKDAPWELLNSYLENLQDHVNEEQIRESFNSPLLMGIDNVAEDVTTWLHSL